MNDRTREAIKWAIAIGIGLAASKLIVEPYIATHDLTITTHHPNSASAPHH